MRTSHHLFFLFTLGILFLIGCDRKPSDGSNELLFEIPDHGFVTREHATKWEEFLVTGNGTLGALVAGEPFREKIILSHEELFMPEYEPTPAPDLASHMDEIRHLVLNGDGQEAAQLAVELGKKVGIDELIWTDPQIPACQIELEDLAEGKVLDYARGVDYETGEAITAWKTEKGIFERRVFASRPDQLVVMSMTAKNENLNIRLKLSTLPVSDEEMNHEAQEFMEENLIEKASSMIQEDGKLTYTTEFKKKWDGSLKGYVVETMVLPRDGSMETDNEWLYIKGARELLVLSRIILSYDLPLSRETGLDTFKDKEYSDLLERHAAVQSEMFNRFSIQLKGGTDAFFAEDLLNQSEVGNMNNQLVNQVCEAARYLLIGSTGEIPPTLQGIWGGTWRPAWSGDFTLNGNVPSAIASGLNTNFPEVTRAYMNYMYSLYDDFLDNASDLYDAPGIFVPSRTSSDGKTYHYAEPYPHLFWYAGAAWTAQFFFDYWQYSRDDEYLKRKVIPLMLDAAAFYENILVKDKSNRYNFIPSYSPEIAPVGHHPVAINATMDIAALKQLIRNLLYLARADYIADFDIEKWTEILDGLPDYSVDEKGDLKEWIWPGLMNDNSHRHASHLYPLFYEVDPEFKDNPALKEAAKTAIENRLEYRRGRDGGEMAFGLVQLGLAAAHIHAADQAYECVEWLCHSYWSPVFTSYHDPMEIFNVDIAGGLPAVVTEMIIQSSRDELILLPALPAEWSEGSITGAGTRCGITVDFNWRDGEPETVLIMAHSDAQFNLRFGKFSKNIRLKPGESLEWSFSE